MDHDGITRARRLFTPSVSNEEILTTSLFDSPLITSRFEDVQYDVISPISGAIQTKNTSKSSIVFDIQRAAPQYFRFAFIYTYIHTHIHKATFFPFNLEIALKPI